MKMRMIAGCLLLMAIFSFSGCGTSESNQNGQEITSEESGSEIDESEENEELESLTPEERNCKKETDCCLTNNDCEYIVYTGGCHTREYAGMKQREADQQGRLLEEAPKRDNVTCTCEDKKCVTHN